VISELVKVFESSELCGSEIATIQLGAVSSREIRTDHVRGRRIGNRSNRDGGGNASICIVVGFFVPAATSRAGVSEAQLGSAVSHISLSRRALGSTSFSWFGRQAGAAIGVVAIRRAHKRT
jgi:hypothetical protein